MTTKPEVVAWRWRKPVVNDQGETVGVTDWVLSETPEFLPWWTNDPLVRLSDYEALKAAYEEELFCVRQDRDAHFGELMRALEQVDALQAECEKLRKDAEFGRSVLAKREPGKVYGCHCDIDEWVEPDGCVIDSGERHYCIYAKNITVKEQCDYWRVIVSDAAIQKEHNP